MLKRVKLPFFVNVIFDKEHSKQKLGESFVMLIHIRVAAESFTVLFFKEKQCYPQCYLQFTIIAIMNTFAKAAKLPLEGT